MVRPRQFTVYFYSQCILAINCYLPSGVNQTDLVEYQESLAIISNILSTHTDDAIVISGDFNADTVNPNNKRSLGYLRAFLEDAGLISITEELGSQGNFTYRSDDGAKTSFIDGFLTLSSSLHQFADLTIGPDTPLNTSDHLLVRIKWSIVLPGHTDRPKHATTTQPAQKLQRLKIKWTEASKDQIAAQYTDPLEITARQLFTTFHKRVLDNTSVDDLLHKLTTAMIETSLSLPHSYPSTGKHGKPEWTAKVEDSYNAALEVWKRWKTAAKPRSGTLVTDYLLCRKKFRSQLRQSRAHNNRKLLNCIENACETNQQLFHKLVKNQRSKDRDASSSSAFDIPEKPTFSAPMYALTITSHDIKEATTKLKKGKASGPDNISPEHLIYIGKATMHLILLIYNYYLSTAHTSQKMKDGLILPFHKGKGKDPRDPRNYRGITLSSSFSKLLELILKPRLEKTLQGNGIPDELQFGFQKNHSCMLTSCTMEFIIEINTCQKRPTYVALLDAVKAFDKVWHDGLFYKVDQTNIDPAYTALLRSLYENMESRVLWSDKTSGAIPILQGVRQGGVLSPLLYTVFVDGLIKELRDKRLGCQLLSQHAGVIVLADDVALVSSSPTELQEMLNVTCKYAETWRYRVNPQKSKIVTFNNKAHKSTA
ncbi:uncharacterized protein LOC115920515 [Strongylocentrotus purpuratus]|uniref:Reverse transcriptase domain-containing protein n=1 Tax=Strongylocentrotus purpuratus TaxID=7668 RepID=A0A7M7NA62_STRPU|nr:uncharacterized protein LOC115920515 [Strongylocentrotus purpuratus]